MSYKIKTEDLNCEIVDFGTVYCIKKFTRALKVTNKSTIDQIFAIERYSDRPSLETGFSIKPVKSPPIKPNEEFTFIVQFVPNTFDIRCCDSFLIIHLYGVYCVLNTRAIVKGPECSLSCSQLHLVCPRDKKKVSKQFDLKNYGQCTVNFQFTVGEHHPLVSVEPRSGSISPSERIHITVTYTPFQKQTYFKRMFCLIPYHEPLALDVYATWLKSDENIKLKVVDIHSIPTYISGYHCFFYDVMSRFSKDEVPLVSLDKHCIDFGHCQPKNNKLIEFSVTNNSSNKLCIVWHQGVFTKELKIQPIEAEIEVNNCKKFSATFKPTVKDRLYGAVLEAHVFSSCGLVPVPLEINVKGDSFDELSCGWAAQYTVEPSSLVLPPCVASPFCPSHSSLTIHRRGHLPLAYSFHPPPLTNFCLKPQQGVIDGGFQIVIVQYQPRALYEAVDTENWLLTFNSNDSMNQCIVKIGCSIETPHVVLNGGKDLVIPPVHPGTEYELPLDLYNPTRFSFWFNMDVVGAVGDVLAVEGAGEMWPNQHCKIALIFRPHGPGRLEAQIACNPALEESVVGKATSTLVAASCCETRLTANPEKLLLLKVMRDFKHKRFIEVTNSGDAIIRASFSWQPDENCSIEDFDISFDPETLYLKPGDSINVEVSITPLTIGERNFIIKYVASSSHDATLVPVTVVCVFPVVQITDVRITNTAPLFTKMHYWKMMQINKFNAVLASLRPTETPEVRMSLPSYVCVSRPVSVELLMENSSELAAQATVRPLFTCDCRPTKRQVSFSTSRWDHDCPHRHQVQIGPAAVDVKAGSYVILKMEISYKTVGDIESDFILTFTPEDYVELSCSVKLRVSRTSIPKQTAFVDTTEPKENGDFVFNMRPVYIGDVTSFAQGFLLYNNTKQYVDFEIDDSNLIGTPFKYVGEKNQIPSTANHNLLFTFLPYCCDIFQAEVTLKINNTHQKLILRGTGVCDPLETNKVVEYFPKEDRLNQLSPPDVFFSKSHINVGPMNPESILKDVFFLNNNTNDIISFMFLSIRTAEVVKLRVTPVKGLVQPGECVECHLSCSCSGRPHRVDVTLACAHANFSQYASNIQALNRYYEDLVASLNNFNITERGSQTQTVTPPSETWPVKNYLTIGVTIDVRDLSFMVDKDIVPVCPFVVEPQPDNVSGVVEENKLLIIEVLERILWQVLEESYRNAEEKNNSLVLHYEQIKNTEKQTEIRVPDHATQNILEDVLHTAWQDLFVLSGFRSCELFRRRLIHQTTNDSRNRGRHSSSGIPTVTSISDSFISMWSERGRES